MGENEATIAKGVDETDGLVDGKQYLVDVHFGTLFALCGELLDVSAKMMRSGKSSITGLGSRVGLDADVGGAERASCAERAEKGERRRRGDLCRGKREALDGRLRLRIDEVERMTGDEDGQRCLQTAQRPCIRGEFVGGTDRDGRGFCRGKRCSW